MLVVAKYGIRGTEVLTRTRNDFHLHRKSVYPLGVALEEMMAFFFPRLEGSCVHSSKLHRKTICHISQITYEVDTPDQAMLSHLISSAMI